jgi:hypothetical protein
MRLTRIVLALVCLISGTLVGQEAKVTVVSKDLTEFRGKEALMITVEYPPGSVDPIHRHNAPAFIYVLEGSIVMQVRGRQRNDFDTWSDLLRGSERCPRNWAKRKPNRTGEIRCVLRERQRGSRAGARQIRHSNGMFHLL